MGERPRHDRRHAITKGLAEGAIMMAAAVGGTLTVVVIRAAGLQANLAQAMDVDAARRRNAIRDRRHGLNGQRQSEEECCQPTGHQKRLSCDCATSRASQ
jgi:hypothetical protein